MVLFVALRNRLDRFRGAPPSFVNSLLSILLELEEVGDEGEGDDLTGVIDVRDILECYGSTMG